MRRAAFLIVATAIATCAWSEEPRPALARSYLKEILDSPGIIEDPVERRVLEGLTDWSLLAFLGYVAPVPPPRVGPPKVVNGMIEDNDPFLFVQLDRMRLQSSFAARIDNRPRAIYVFAAFTGWPGMNNTCIVVTDGSGYLLDWRGRMHSDIFESASYENGSLSVTCKRRTGGKRIYRYTITVESIESDGIESVPK